VDNIAGAVRRRNKHYFTAPHKFLFFKAMTFSNVSGLEPKTWRRFLLFLLVILSLLLVFSFFAPLPNTTRASLSRVSD
jgi:hypothetical protein